MPLIFCGGLEAVHVSLIGPAPIAHLKVPLNDGVTVLFGRNGAGKSTVLDRVRRALRGVAAAEGEVRLHCRLTEAPWDGGHADLLVLAAFSAELLGTSAGCPESSLRSQVM